MRGLSLYRGFQGLRSGAPPAGCKCWVAVWLPWPAQQVEHILANVLKLSDCLGSHARRVGVRLAEGHKTPHTPGVTMHDPCLSMHPNLERAGLCVLPSNRLPEVL